MQPLRARPGATIDDPPTGADPSEQGEASGAAERRSWAPAVVVISVAVALLPLIVAPLRALGRGWIPVGDDAIFAIRATDVFSGDNPLIGMYSSFSDTVGFELSNPGPLHFDLVALPVLVLGQVAGVALGVALVNALAVVGTVVFAYRRGGPLTAAVAAAAGAWLSYAMGSELLFEPFPSHSPLLPALLLLVLVWSIASGDLVALPWAAGVGSLVVQTHLSYGFLIVLLAAWALAALAYDLRRRRRQEPGAWYGLRRRAVGMGAVAAVVLALAWIQPAVEQLTGEGEGNLRRISRALREPVETLGATRGSRLLAAVVTSPPWELRDAVFAGPPALLIALVLLALVGLALGALLWATWRRQDGVAITALGTAGVALVGALFTAARVPPAAPLRTAFSVAPHHVMWMWVIHTFVLLAVVVAVLRLLADRGVRRERLVAAVAAITVVIAVANLPSEDQGAVGPPVAIDESRELRDELPDLSAEGTLLVRAPGGFDPYGPAVMAELQERGVPFVLDDPVLLRQLGQDRAYTGENAEVVLTVIVGGEAGEALPGARRLLLGGPEEEEQRALAMLEEQIGRFIREGLPLNDNGRELLAAGVPASLQGTDPEEGVDPELLLETRDLLLLIGTDSLALDDAWQERFSRYAELRQRADAVTVALFLEPLADG